MAEPLFGIDIAQTVADGFAAAGGLNVGTLTKAGTPTRDAANPTLTRLSQPSTHTFQGYREDRSVLRRDTETTEKIVVIGIIANSIAPAAVPEINDRVVIRGGTFTLNREISFDAGGALYEFEGV